MLEDTRGWGDLQSGRRPELAAAIVVAIVVAIVSLIRIWPHRTEVYRTFYGHVLKTDEKGRAIVQR
jgi:hypothetical protein